MPFFKPEDLLCLVDIHRGLIHVEPVPTSSSSSSSPGRTIPQNLLRFSSDPFSPFLASPSARLHRSNSTSSPSASSLSSTPVTPSIITSDSHTTWRLFFQDASDAISFIGKPPKLISKFPCIRLELVCHLSYCLPLRMQAPLLPIVVRVTKKKLSRRKCESVDSAFPSSDSSPTPSLSSSTAIDDDVDQSVVKSSILSLIREQGIDPAYMCRIDVPTPCHRVMSPSETENKRQVLWDEWTKRQVE